MAGAIASAFLELLIDIIRVFHYSYIADLLHNLLLKALKLLDFYLNGVQEAAGSNPVTRTKKC